MSHNHSPVRMVALIKAIQRKPRDFKVTFFSKRDEWWFDGILDAKICVACREMDWIRDFNGVHLRRDFPWLSILDINTIGGAGANSTGLVHPHCRCRLRRKVMVWNV